MRKKLFFLPIVAALALTGCSNEDLPDPEGGNGGGNEGVAGTRYLAVSIVSTPSGDGSRAADDEVRDPQLPTGYEYGKGDENRVDKVRFYFYTSANDAVSVKAGQNVNYYEWTPTEDEKKDQVGSDPTHTVERQLNAVLIIETSEGDRLPGKIVAVINPDESRLGTGSLTLQELRNVYADYAALANAGNPEFVMCNSVYMDRDGMEVGAQVVKAENYAESAEEAKNLYPVQIYVERNVAKVRTRSSIDTTADGSKLIVYDKDGKTPLKVDDKQVYLKLNGWNVTATLQYGYMSKHIDVKWETGLLSINWNAPQYFRSFWADECAFATDNNYIDFNTMKKYQFNSPSESDARLNYTYCNENAQKGNASKKNTKIIVNGTLCDEYGNALTVAEYAGMRFISVKKEGETDLQSLKEAYLFQLENKQRSIAYYKKTIVEGKEVYTEISPADITFKTATAAGKYKYDKNANHGGSYYVYACLTPEASASDVEWHTSNIQGNTDVIAASEIDKALLSLPEAKIWNGGDTYYFADIQHFNKYGVVRNHVYDINLTKVVGLGTPVYDPNEVIYPEIPEKSNTFIAAKINILSWRVISSDVILNGAEK